MNNKIPILDFENVTENHNFYQRNYNKLQESCRDLKELMHLAFPILEYKFDDRWEISKLLFHFSLVSADAVCTLLTKPDYFYSESLVTSRGLYEKLVNSSYLLVCPEEEFKKYVEYAGYRQIKDKQKSQKCGDWEIGSTFDYESFPHKHKFEELKKTFRKQKRGDQNWSDKSILDKIEYFSESFQIEPIFFLSFHNLIWRISSEYSHGSYYGLIEHLKYTKNSQETDLNIENFSLNGITLIVYIITLYYNVLFEIYGNKFDISSITDNIRKKNIIKRTINYTDTSSSEEAMIFLRKNNEIFEQF